MLDADTNEAFGVYRRHGSADSNNVRVLDEIVVRFLSPIFAALCADRARRTSRGITAPFHSKRGLLRALRRFGALYPQANCTIELGGQDAKMIFFRPMNLACRNSATCAWEWQLRKVAQGAFIDEVAPSF